MKDELPWLLAAAAVAYLLLRPRKPSEVSGGGGSDLTGETPASPDPSPTTTTLDPAVRPTGTESLRSSARVSTSATGSAPRVRAVPTGSPAPSAETLRIAARAQTALPASEAESSDNGEEEDEEPIRVSTMSRSLQDQLSAGRTLYPTRTRFSPF